MPGPEAWPVRGEDLAFSNSAATRMGAECVRPRCRGILPSDNGVSKCNILTPHWPRLGLWHIGYVPCTIGRDRHHIASPKRLSRYRYGCIGSGITCRIGSTRGGGPGVHIAQWNWSLQVRLNRGNSTTTFFHCSH